jgi:hypothetical protein
MRNMYVVVLTTQFVSLRFTSVIEEEILTVVVSDGAILICFFIIFDKRVKRLIVEMLE